MKTWKYVLVILFGLFMTSCTEQEVRPREGEDGPIVIPPPPPK